MQTSYEDSARFKVWKAELALHGVTLRGAEPLEIVRKPNGEVLFSFLRIDAVTEKGESLLPVVLLRGHFVAVLTCLINQATGERWYLMVKQRRVANGDYFYEHPAGMMDEEGNPADVAIKEVEEETGLQVSKRMLIPLNDTPLYSSPGLLDEGGWFFACELPMSGEAIQALHGRKTGDSNEGEDITTVVMNPKEALNVIRNTNGLLHIFMYEQFKVHNP